MESSFFNTLIASMLLPNEIERRQLLEVAFGHDLSHRRSETAFNAYLTHYSALVVPYSKSSSADAVINIGTPALRSHSDVIECVRDLQNSAKLTFDEFVASSTVLRSIDLHIERERVANLAINVLLMMDCGLKDYHSDEFKQSNLGNSRWKGGIRLHEFIEQTFAAHGIDSLKPPRFHNSEAIRHKKSLKAWKLIKRYGIEIQPTNNILEHLVYSPSTRSVKVFHHVAFLRAQLERTKDLPWELGFKECLEKGALPPKLLFETLLTIHHILFPIANIADRRSHSLLGRLIRYQGFDEEGSWIEYVRPYPHDMEFEYWQDRLEKLYGVVKRPPPANAIVAWFERHTSERNALTVAIVGLFLAVLLGFIGVIIGVLQLTVAWLAWKYPKPDSS